ncbi:MAG: LamG domain-containing protein, partial [Ekhidna sp.]|nr:LamG domain-containing protein [Ekhidna sp.]
RSVNTNDGTLNGSVTSVTSSVPLAPPPLAPTNLIAYESGGNIVLEWLDNANNETGFLVERADDYAFTTNVLDITSAVGSPGVDAISATYDPLGIDYYYRVTAVNGFEDSTSQSSVEFASPNPFAGQALSFDGSDDYVDIPLIDFSTGNAFTLEAWIKADDITSTSESAIIRQNATNGSYDFFLGFASNGTELRVGVTAGSQRDHVVAIDPAYFTDGNWHHIAGNYQSGSLQVYIDGVSQGGTGKTGTPRFSPTGFNVIGAKSSNGASYVSDFNGQIDEVRIYNIRKTDFSDRFAPLRGDEANLVAYYPFDEGVAANETVDRSTDTKDGQITGATSVASGPLPAYYYWVGDGGNWSDFTNHWSTSSGGSPNHTSVPTSSDNVIFDANSFTTNGQSVTIDVEANMNDMNWTGVLNSPSISGSAGAIINIHGSLTMASGVTLNTSYDGRIEFESNSVGNTITTAGVEMGQALNSQIDINGTGEWTLVDDLSAYQISVNAGNLVTAGNNVTTGRRTIINGGQLDFSNSTITAGFYDFFSGTVVSTNSTIIIDTQSGFSTFRFRGGNQAYNDVIIREAGNTTQFFGSNSFNNLTFEPGSQIEFQAPPTTQTINQLVATGTITQSITLTTSIPGTQATISQAVGTVNGNWLELQDIVGTGGATFNANNSIDNGNNSGWLINEPSLANTETFDGVDAGNQNVNFGSYFELLGGGILWTGSQITPTNNASLTKGGTGISMLLANPNGQLTASVISGLSQITFSARAEVDASNAVFNVLVSEDGTNYTTVASNETVSTD